MSFIDNSDKIINELNAKIEDASKSTPLDQIITDSFVSEYTVFSGYEELMTKIQEISPNFEITAEVDKLVAENSQFSTFDELYATAAKEKLFMIFGNDLT